MCNLHLLRRKIFVKVIFFIAVFVSVVGLCGFLSIPSYAAEQTIDVGIPVEENPELFRNRSMPTHGNGKIAVFLIDFPDYRNDNPVATQEFYDKLYFRGGMETAWGDVSVASYYKAQSYGKLNLSGRVFDWYTAKHERSYYDNKKAELIAEAAEHYASQGVDFSQYDGDGDGVIDAVVFHFAGETNSARYSPWYGGVCNYVSGQAGGVKFKSIVQLREDAKSSKPSIIKTVCHELMHTLGMQDLYSEMHTALFPVRDLMSDNEYVINPYTKILLGWVDNVKVITADSQDVRLDPFGAEASSNTVAIVTNKFNGFFDEFFVVAYREYSRDNSNWKTYPTVWHVNACLSEDGRSFQYQNLRYSYNPESIPHYDGKNISPYPFMEELSADPSLSNLDGVTPISRTVFGKDSVLGPDSVPSSDTVEGAYTGIRISDFVTYDGLYLTFDVAFVKDISAPIVTTDSQNIQFNQTVTIRFNERIYKGEAFNSIYITDLDGNRLNATAVLPYYPNHEIEITFRDDSYKNGYIIVFPDGCLRDSSGNRMHATKVVASPTGRVFPINQSKLPNWGYPRDNTQAFFIHEEDSLVVITSLWDEERVFGAKVEFMRLDYSGNVLKHTVIDNPFTVDPELGRIDSVAKAGDGSFVVFWRAYSIIDRVFCIDANGKLKWTNEEYYKSGAGFTRDKFYEYKEGVIATFQGNTVYIDSGTGKVEPLDKAKKIGISLPNGKMLVHDGIDRAKKCNIVQILDAQTFEVETEGRISWPTEVDTQMTFRGAYANDDGTFILYFEDFAPRFYVFLLDANLNVVKGITLPAITEDNRSQVGFCWVKNDGFCKIYRTKQADHNADTLVVYRYDRYLNHIWTLDVTANFVYFFLSDSGEIMAYKSMNDPRECYIENYGKEDAFKSAHIHNLVYTEEVPATCQNEGSVAHWRCTECGCIYSDEGETLITDTTVLILPISEHAVMIDNAVAPTCEESGLTEGKHCAICGKVLETQKKVPATGHTEMIDEAVKPTCTKSGLTEGKHCAVCGKVLETQKRVPATEHTEMIDEAIKPTCTKSGLTEGKHCAVCSRILEQQKKVPATGHTEMIDEAVKPTCIKSGLTEGKHCAVCGKVLEQQQTVPAIGTHSFTEWMIDSTEKTESHQCRTCGYREERPLAAVGALIKKLISNPPLFPLPFEKFVH